MTLLDVLDNSSLHYHIHFLELLNSQYAFDDPYLQCVMEHMDELKSFGDVTNKLVVQG